MQVIVKQAVANFKERESLPKDYTYLETVKAEDSSLKHGHSVDVYEVIEIGGHGFRRHLAQDGKKIAHEQEIVRPLLSTLLGGRDHGDQLP